MGDIIVTPQDIMRLREAGPSGWLVCAAGTIHIVESDPIGTGALEIATFYALADLAEAYRERGAEPTDREIANDLSDIASDYATEWGLLAHCADLLAPLVELLKEFEIVRAGPPLIGRVDGVQQLTQDWRVPNSPSARVHFDLVVDGSITIEAAAGTRWERRLILNSDIPFEALAVGLAALAGRSSR